MQRLRRLVVAPLLAALAVLAVAETARGSVGPKWSAAQLIDFADVIVTGRVEAITSGWDPAVDSIYTYVTIDVDEVYKGLLGQDHIIVKQLGGMVGDVGLAVADQPEFSLGEHVLLYLEARPRDGSLYTAALWQGKWTIETDALGNRVAMRVEPSHGRLGTIDRQSLSAVRARAAGARRSMAAVNTTPDDAQFAVAQPFELLGPFRYLFVPPVDVQSGGQPGLSGGGFSQIGASISRWNNAGSGTRLSGGSNAIGPRCSSQQLGNSRVTIAFMDPCGEISNSGGTLAIGGSYFFNGGGGTNNGQSFHRASEGFIVNNDSNTALNFLTVPGCFEDIQTHELGHVLGLGHSADPNAIMFPSIDNSCVNAANALGQDDISGIVFIYGGSGGGTTPPSSAPTNVQVAVNGTTSITVSWNAVNAFVAAAPGAATSYRLDFRASPGGPVVAAVTSAATSITIPLPPGTQGTFNVTVTPLNSAGAGPSSNAVSFTIGSGGPGPCTSAPAPVTGVSGGVSGGVARVQWNPSAGASSYRVQAGNAQGGADLFPLTDIGNNTGAQAPVPAGFRAWVRIFAVNACGTSAGVDFFLQ